MSAVENGDVAQASACGRLFGEKASREIEWNRN